MPFCGAVCMSFCGVIISNYDLAFSLVVVADEFSFDPVSKTYGDPQRRPEIRSATIEFIAPSEYMASSSSQFRNFSNIPKFRLIWTLFVYHIYPKYLDTLSIFTTNFLRLMGTLSWEGVCHFLVASFLTGLLLKERICPKRGSALFLRGKNFLFNRKV